MENMEIFETIRTTRAMRRLKSDPVPNELIDKILDAAVCAPSGGNNQNWGFIVVSDKVLMRDVQRYYKKAFDTYVLPHYESQRDSPPAGMDVDSFSRQIKRVEHLTDHFHEAPVWIVACLNTGSHPATYLSGASIYPAVQNMLLAARALGLGATLTTRHAFYAEQVDELFGLPNGVRSYAILPIGYPEGKFGPLRRGSVDKVVFTNKWGETGDR